MWIFLVVLAGVVGFAIGYSWNKDEIDSLQRQLDWHEHRSK